MDDLGSSKKIACNSNSIDIKCKTDNTTYQALDMVVPVESDFSVEPPADEIT